MDLQLRQFIEAILADRTSEVEAMLTSWPSLATIGLTAGATRESPQAHFVESIGHQLYTGDTALHAAAAGYRVSYARLLLAHGANPRAANRMGATPLHYAADGMPGAAGWNPAAQAEMVGLLIEAGADPNGLDKLGVAPLHRAVRKRCPAAVEALLKHGAQSDLRNKNGSTPMDLARTTTGRSGSGSAEAKACQAEIIALLTR